MGTFPPSLALSSARTEIPLPQPGCRQDPRGHWAAMVREEQRLTSPLPLSSSAPADVHQPPRTGTSGDGVNRQKGTIVYRQVHFGVPRSTHCPACQHQMSYKNQIQVTYASNSVLTCFRFSGLHKHQINYLQGVKWDISNKKLRTHLVSCPDEQIAPIPHVLSELPSSEQGSTGGLGIGQ